MVASTHLKGPVVSQLLRALREETAPLHRRLDQHRLLRRLLARDLTRAEYVEVLAKLYGFYLPLERQLAAQPGWSELAIDLGERLRTPLLAVDLEALGVDRTRLPLARKIPCIEGLAEAVGCFYVLEGASLGGEVIARQVQRSLGLDQGTGLAFFIGHGERVGAMWAEARRAIGAFEALAPSAGWRAVGAAAATFAMLGAWLGGSDDRRGEGPEHAGVG
jgi:heme oxygenase